MKLPVVYILTNKKDGTLYTGVTSNLARRIFQHKSKLVKGFMQKYLVDKLVWYEVHSSMFYAIQREKRIKSWKRNWKIELIEKTNPNWEELVITFF